MPMASVWLFWDATAELTRLRVRKSVVSANCYVAVRLIPLTRPQAVGRRRSSCHLLAMPLVDIAVEAELSERPLDKLAQLRPGCHRSRLVAADAHTDLIHLHRRADEDMQLAARPL